MPTPPKRPGVQGSAKYKGPDGDRTTIEYDRPDGVTPRTKYGKPLSTKPRAIRGRLRRQAVAQVADIELLYGKPIAEWDLEELAAGRPRDKSGGWHGTGPRMGWGATPVMKEIQHRFLELTVEKVHNIVPAAIKVVMKMLTDESVGPDGYPVIDAKTKLDAAKFIIEHVIGKPKQRVDMTADDSIKAIMAAALVNPDGMPSHPIIEGEIVEDYDDDDD